MTKVNIREALNQMDKDTNCKYDLVTLYEGYNFNDEEKKEIAKMISDNEDAEVIYDKLSDKFEEDVNFDDDDNTDDLKFIDMSKEAYLYGGDDYGFDDYDFIDHYDDLEDGYDDEELASGFGGDRNKCPKCGSPNYHDGHCYACDPNYIPDELEEDKNNNELVNDLVKKAFTPEQAEYLVSHDKGMAEYLAYGNAESDDFEYFIKYINKRLNEDTIKTSKGKWVNKGEEGTHGTFDTKKEADAQRKAMFASGWKGESITESFKDTNLYRDLLAKVANAIRKVGSEEESVGLDEDNTIVFKLKYGITKHQINDLHDMLEDISSHNPIKEFQINTLPWTGDTYILIAPDVDFSDEQLKEELKTYYVSYKENEGNFKDKYVDLPVKASSKEEAEEKFLKDHPNIKSYDYKVISQESLKESVDNDTKELFRQAARDKVFSTHIYNHYPFSGAIELMDEVDENGEGRKLKFTSRDEMNSKADELLDNGYISYTYKRSQDESLKEASYGGAYDISDDEYFTKDDGMEAANEIVYKLEKEFPEAKLELMDMQLDNHSFYVTLTDKDGNEFSEEITLDMRKIRHPLDLIKKYSPALTERFIRQIKDYYAEM